MLCYNCYSAEISAPNIMSLNTLVTRLLKFLMTGTLLNTICESQTWSFLLTLYCFSFICEPMVNQAIGHINIMIFLSDISKRQTECSKIGLLQNSTGDVILPEQCPKIEAFIRQPSLKLKTCLLLLITVNINRK